MPFTGPYPTKFSGHTSEMLISATVFSGSVTNAGTIGPGGGVIITSSTFLSGGFLNTNLISGTANGIGVLSDSTIQGAIVDSGTIRATKDGILVSGGVVSSGIQVGTHGMVSAGSSAIAVENTTTFAGGINNAGSIFASRAGIDVSTVAVFGGSGTSGGITNTGTISAGHAGIDLTSVGTFFGSIVNGGAGKIFASDGGIDVTSVTVFGAGSVAGGITNAGTISAGHADSVGHAGIDLTSVGTFVGSIVNSGTGKIFASAGGIDVSTVNVFGAGSAAGGIKNAGTISAGHAGIDLTSVGTFVGSIVNSSTGKIFASDGGIDVTSVAVFGAGSVAGGITNAGTISAGHAGIFVSAATASVAIAGSIVNAGTIVASTGFSILDSTIQGALVDSGAIRTTSDGIDVNSGAVIVGGIRVSSKGTISAMPLSASGIVVQNTTTFGGGITNSGVISAGRLAIMVAGVSTFTGGISNGGALSGAAGMLLSNLSIFAGGSGSGGAIVNSGKITGLITGIRIDLVDTFAGGITNSKSGAITAKSSAGIFVGTTSATASAVVSSFLGGITNSGTISGGSNGDGVFVDDVSFFAGGIVNNSGGRIAAGASGIEVERVTTFTGGVSNAGTISGKSDGILVRTVAVFGTGGPGGGITNTGVVSGNNTAIRIFGIASSFSGGISNSGKLIATNQQGILITSVAVFGNTSAGGGIVNSGTISARFTGIHVAERVTSFSGGISNAASGKIVSTTGIGIRLGTDGAVPGDSNAGGGITNSGTISAHHSGISVQNVTTFTGGVSNSGKITGGLGIAVRTVMVFGDPNAGGGIANTGTISAANQGIFVDHVTTFAGGIVNSGRLAAQTGISVSNFVFFGASSSGGGITNSGTITASDHGIVLQNASDFAGVVANTSVIAAHSTGIKIDGVSTLSGGVSNSGTITGTVGDGIEISQTQAHNPIPGGLVSGGITNSGTISAAGAAIGVFDTATFAGGISNSGKLAALKSIAVTSVGFFGDSSAGGGITNTGTMQGGISLQADGTFFGSIVNGSAGKIISGGINFNDGMLFGAGSVAGGITNAGTISLGGGINVHTATFLGNISNSGKIVGDGIGLSSVAVFGGSGGGSIVNSNVISATQVGLRLKNVGILAGGITNAGVISAGGSGIEISRVGTLSGGIVNSGTIAGKNLGIGIFGLGVDDSTVAGGIIDSGTLKGGIAIDFSEVLASGTAIDIAGPTFTGGINIFGAVISGSVGIEIKSAHGVSITDDGAIIGTGGTAIEFAGSGNTLTLEAGYTISGAVDPQSGNNTFQLGGFDSDTFDLSSIGTQYKGFTTFDVVGGFWTVSSASTAHWTIENGGALEITSGGELTSTTVSSGGTLVIDSGATVSGVTIATGATLELFGGIPLPSGVTIPAGATLGVGGGVYSGLVVSTGRTLNVLSGGTDLGATISGGGALIVGSGGTDSGATVLKGAVEKVTSGGISIDATLKSGGTEIVSAGGVASDTKVSSGGAFLVSSGGTADPTTIFSGGSETVSAGGTDLGAQVAGGRLFVLSSGTVVGAGVSSGGTEIVSGHGFDASATVFAGGRLFVQSGGTATDTTIAGGGTAINSVGAILNVVVSATDSGTLVNSGAVNVQPGGTLTVGAATLNNAGSINLSGTVSATELLIEQNVTLSGSGTVSMSGGLGQISGGSGFTLTNVNNKITGVGEIGGSNFTINNQSSGVINGNGSALPLELTANIINAGLIEGTASPGLRIDSATLTNSGTIAALGAGASVLIRDEIVINSTGNALILASGNGAQVKLNGETISGGSLKTSAGGTIAADLATLSGVTIASASLVEVGNSVIFSGGTIGAGAVVETSNGSLFVSGTVSNGGTLLADSAGDEITITLGAVVNGGVAVISNGIVKIDGSSSESVKFLPLGDGGLLIADRAGQTSAFSGKVSGFGGGDHSNNVQFINLPSVAFNFLAISWTYTSANSSNTSGTLSVISSGGLVAAINFVGAYSAGNFEFGPGLNISGVTSGTVTIRDPVVPNGGSVSSDTVGSAMPHSGIDLPDIAFGAQTTLAYMANAAGTGGMLTVSDGRHAAAIALLGNYMAGSFVAVADGHGGTLVTEAQTAQQPLLTHPPHG